MILFLLVGVWKIWFLQFEFVFPKQHNLLLLCNFKKNYRFEKTNYIVLVKKNPTKWVRGSTQWDSLSDILDILDKLAFWSMKT